eukprot:8971995-Lingulodinium_polyedra.AAC.1
MAASSRYFRISLCRESLAPFHPGRWEHSWGVLIDAAQGSRLPGRVFDAGVVNGPVDWHGETNYVHDSSREFWQQRPHLTGPV